MSYFVCFQGESNKRNESSGIEQEPHECGKLTYGRGKQPNHSSMHAI